MIKSIYKISIMPTLIAIGVGGLFLSTQPAFSDSKEDAVKARKEIMKQAGASMKTISGMMTGKVTFDAKELSAKAQSIADHGGKKFTSLFPEGSIVGDTEAMPAIWTDFKQFESLSSDVALYAEALAKSAANPRADGQAAIAMLSKDELKDPVTLAKAAPDVSFALMGKTCGTCHKTFRKPKE